MNSMLLNSKRLKVLSINFVACAALIMVASCSKQNVTPKTNITTTTTTPADTTAWGHVFDDQFSDATSFNNWTKTNRADYNSSFCNYASSDPIIANYDSKSVLVLTASGAGSSYISGHVKSNFSFKPAVNEEYHTSSSIKLIAIDGTTYKSFSQTYGAWPAFWTVQETNWPTQGEVDIMEGYSFNDHANFASNVFYGTATNTNLLGNTCTKSYTVNEGWHLYDEYWKNDNGKISITIKLDGVTVSTYTDAINANLSLGNFGLHNIIFNLNVGSNGNVGIFNNSLINLFSKTMMWVDYVTVDKRKW